MPPRRVAPRHAPRVVSHLSGRLLWCLTPSLHSFPQDRYATPRRRQGPARPRSAPRRAQGGGGVPDEARDEAARLRTESSRPGAAAAAAAEARKTAEAPQHEAAPDALASAPGARPGSAPASALAWRYGVKSFEQRPVEQQILILQQRAEREAKRRAESGAGFGSAAVEADAAAGARAVEASAAAGNTGLDKAAEVQAAERAAEKARLKAGLRVAGPDELARLQAALAAAEARPSVLDQPYDDGFRLPEEREAARRAKRAMVDLARPLERGAAEAVAASLVAALVSTAAELVAQVAVEKRASERQTKLDARQRSLLNPLPAAARQADAAPQVLLDGARRFTGLANELAVGKSLIMMEDLYRMTGVKGDAADEDVAPGGAPDGLPMSRIERMHFRADPNFRRGKKAVSASASASVSDADANAAADAAAPDGGSAAAPAGAAEGKEQGDGAEGPDASAASGGDEAFTVPAAPALMAVPGVLASDGRVVSDAGFDTTALTADVMRSLGVQGGFVARRAAAAPRAGAGPPGGGARGLTSIDEEAAAGAHAVPVPSTPVVSMGPSFAAAGGAGAGASDGADEEAPEHTAGTGVLPGLGVGGALDGGGSSMLEERRREALYSDAGPLTAAALAGSAEARGDALGHVDEARPIGRAVRQLVQPLADSGVASFQRGDLASLKPLQQAKAVFAEEAVLQAHGLGVPGVRSLLVDVRGLEGPMDMRVRAAPPPHPSLSLSG